MPPCRKRCHVPNIACHICVTCPRWNTRTHEALDGGNARSQTVALQIPDFLISDVAPRWTICFLTSCGRIVCTKQEQSVSREP